MKVGDLVLSKYPRIHGDEPGIIIKIRRRRCSNGSSLPPNFYVQWQNGVVGNGVPAIELEKI